MPLQSRPAHFIVASVAEDAERPEKRLTFNPTQCQDLDFSFTKEKKMEKWSTWPPIARHCRLVVFLRMHATASCVCVALVGTFLALLSSTHLPRFHKP